MENIAIVILLLTVVTVLAEITDKIRVPYPILLVLVGIVIGLIPGLPHLELDPEIVFLVFLPPILYGAAWNTSWSDFRFPEWQSVQLTARGGRRGTLAAFTKIPSSLRSSFTWNHS